MLTNTLDIKTFSEQLDQRLKSDLELIAQNNQDITLRASKALLAIRSTLRRLKEFVYEYDFQCKEEEITFFKEVKPAFSSQYYFYDRILALKMNEPNNGPDTLKAYYYRELDQLQGFIRMNQEFYKYCLSNSTQFDEQYFIREGTTFEGIDIDYRFSTGYDNTLAMIQANLLIREHLQNQIKRLDSEYCGSSLTWTDTKTALIELIYALQSVEAINGGKADIKQIAISFESLFNISLGNVYRHYQDLRLRKKGRTPFIDQMREKFSQRLDYSEQ